MTKSNLSPIIATSPALFAAHNSGTTAGEMRGTSGEERGILRGKCGVRE